MTSSPKATTTHNQIILVVEDEVLISEILCEILENEGLAAVAKPDADQALAYLNAHAHFVALILTDINMPGSINGAGLANHSRLAWPQIPIIVMSGKETPEGAGISVETPFLRKPFVMAEMVSAVRASLEVTG